jgi:hypothetical protein
MSMEAADGAGANFPGGNPARGNVSIMKADGQNIASTTTSPGLVPQNTGLFNPGLVGAVLAKSGNNVTVGNNQIVIDTTKNGFEWVNLALNLSVPTDFIDFKFDFSTDTDGTLSMRIDNSLLWAGLDQYALTNQDEDTGLLTLPAALGAGQHLLSFRLDAGAANDSDVTLSDINTGLVPEPTGLVLLCAATCLLRRQRQRLRDLG